jgi:hypothetical protein
MLWRTRILFFYKLYRSFGWLNTGSLVLKYLMKYQLYKNFNLPSINFLVLLTIFIKEMRINYAI